MMTVSERLITLRKRAGLSQEQLADHLGVTRQSVSKWESGASMPDLTKLIALSEFFEITLDELVKGKMESSGSTAEFIQETARLERKVDDLTQYLKGSFYVYDSPIRLFGLPLLSVRIGCARTQPMGWEYVAKGIFAIGNAAIGVVSLGLFSAGLISIGCLTMGVLALGAVAVGGAAFGAAAIGILALGVATLGIYAGGVCAVGAKIAVGIAAAARETAIGCDVSAAHILLWGDGLKQGEAAAFLLRQYPNLASFLVRLFSGLAAHLQ